MPAEAERANGVTVLVAGSGVAALEAVLSLRALGGDRLSVQLIAPDEEFAYRPLAVVEPFGLPVPGHLPLARLAETHGVRLRRDRLASVHASTHRVKLASGAQVRYDALVIATGARPERWLAGALTLRGSQDVAAYRTLLGELESGELQRLLFAVPPGVSWTLPLYELALLTTAWIADREVIGAELTLVTPAPRPLQLLGPSAARAVRDLLGDRGIRLVTDTQVVSIGRDGAVSSDGTTIRADRVVTLPRLSGDAPEGVPTDVDGFVATDDYGAVPGLDDVYAAGDVTAYPVKQASLAAEQADAAASAIAARLVGGITPEPFVPMLRALLLTGVAATGFNVDLSGAGTGLGLGPEAPWWPPEKIAARHLAPYLAEQVSLPDVSERERAASEPEDQQRRLALEFAHADAAEGNYRSALNWLAVVERIDRGLSPAHAELRERWTIASAD
jgi:sulfide:quinone oxidoreductase